MLLVGDRAPSPIHALGIAKRGGSKACLCCPPLRELPAAIAADASARPVSTGYDDERSRFAARQSATLFWRGRSASMCRIFNAKLIFARLDRIARSVSMSGMWLFVGRMGRVAATLLGLADRRTRRLRAPRLSSQGIANSHIRGLKSYPAWSSGILTARRSRRSIVAVGPGWDRLDLLERALMRRLIWTPAHQLRSVAKSIAGDMVEPYLNDELRSQRLPFPTSLGAPAARTARGFSGKAGSLA